MTKRQLTEPNVQNLRKASKAIYLACEKVVADDVSNLLRWSADRIEAIPGHDEIMSDPRLADLAKSEAQRVGKAIRADTFDQKEIYRGMVAVVQAYLTTLSVSRNHVGDQT